MGEVSQLPSTTVEALVRHFFKQARRIHLIVFISLIGTIGLPGCGFKIEPEKSCNFVQNSHKQRVSWNGKLPVLIYIHESMPEAKRPSVDAAIQKWNDQAGGAPILKSGGVINEYNNPQHDGANIIYYRDQWDAKHPDEQGRTTVYWSGTQIFEADVLINGKDFEFSVTAEPEAGKVDLESLLVHEL